MNTLAYVSMILRDYGFTCKHKYDCILVTCNNAHDVMEALAEQNAASGLCVVSISERTVKITYL